MFRIIRYEVIVGLWNDSSIIIMCGKKSNYLLPCGYFFFEHAVDFIMIAVSFSKTRIFRNVQRSLIYEVVIRFEWKSIKIVMSVDISINVSSVNETRITLIGPIKN